LAAAVQVLCYELMMRAQDALKFEVVESEEPLAAAGDLELFYQHLEQTLIELGFLNPTNPRYLIRRLRRLFNRARLTDNEVNILRGILSAMHASRTG
jgi:tRNA (cytidine32/uridine32-2'-O)-methyltransferase